MVGSEKFENGVKNWDQAVRIALHNNDRDRFGTVTLQSIRSSMLILRYFGCGSPWQRGTMGGFTPAISVSPFRKKLTKSCSHHTPAKIFCFFFPEFPEKMAQLGN